MQGLKEELQKIVGGEVHDDDKTREAFSHDTSLFEVKPEVVVAPRNSQDIKNLVSFVNKNRAKDPNLSLTARAAGTCMSGGSLNESIILDFTKHFTHFSVDEAALRATVEPGVYYRNLEKETEPKGIVMPSYPASKSIAALGGMIMNNSGGEKSLKYGQTQNFVEEMNVVCSDGNEYTFKKLTKDELEKKKTQDDFEGELYRRTYDLLENNYDLVQGARPDVAKNSSGYFLWNVWDREHFDLTQLFAGSQGTLGIFTKAKLKLVKEKSHKRLVVLFFDSWKELPEVVNAVLPCEPESLESFDDETLKLGIRFMPEIAKKVGSNLLSFALRFLPEAWIGIKMRGLPKLIVLVQLVEDSEKEVREKIARVERAVKPFKIQHRVIGSEKEADKYWVMRRESFALLRKHVSGKRTAPFVDDFCVKPELIPEFLPKMLKILKDHGIRANIAGHAGSGNFHIIPLMDLTDKTEREKIPVVSDKVYDLIIKYKGTITAEHNDGIIRTPYLEKMYGPRVYALFREVKEIFDPHNIFNPGKKVDGSLEYMRSHINPK